MGPCVCARGLDALARAVPAGGAGCPTAQEDRAPRPAAGAPSGRGVPAGEEGGSCPGMAAGRAGPAPGRRARRGRADRRTDGRTGDGWPAPPGGPRARAGCGRAGTACSSPIVGPARQWAARGGTCSPEKPINRLRVQLPSRPSPRTGEPSTAAPEGEASAGRRGHHKSGRVAGHRRVLPPAPAKPPARPAGTHLASPLWSAGRPAPCRTGGPAGRPGTHVPAQLSQACF